jgi:hypothetical protein
MAQTTTGITACDAGLWLDTAAGTATDISGSSNKISMNFNQEIGDKNTFQSKWKRRFECGKDASFTLEVIYTTAADEGFDILKDWFFAAAPGDRTLTVYLPNKNVGSDVYAAEVKIESLAWDAEAGIGDPVMVTASLLPNGEVTHSQAAT